MSRAHRPTPEFPAHLRELHRKFPLARSLAQDPLSCVRPFASSRRGAEIAGIFASTLAVGTTTSIRGAFSRLRAGAGDDPESWVASRGRPPPGGGWDGFQHRWIRGDQMGFLAGRLSEIYGSHESLEDVFLEGSEGGGFAGGLDALAHALRAPPGSVAPRGYDRLYPSPLDPPRSPCKRLTLFVRWMVRREYPDLGLWTRISPADLRIPLDQHVYWIAFHLGLTHRRTRGWATVEEVTEALRRVDPADPIRYDFVLCHTGISGDCPKRRDESVCGACSVRPDCLMWRGRRGVS
ncbi:MAG TPA: DUF2400 domain-containing protein [Thermoplasmata archaeon]|nr:DUF2400 domain-containing protein [Thermoplasmata archaeon]